MSRPSNTALTAAASALAAAAGLTAYAALSPGSQLLGPTLIRPPLPHQLALTFDDGPNPAATPRLLDVLARRNVRATFFLIGSYVLRERALTREIAAAGHHIGNHTQHHPWLPRHSAAFIREEVRACTCAIEDTTGVPVTLFRPPHGARSPLVMRVAEELALRVTMWNIIVGDWKPLPAEALLARLESRVGRNLRRDRASMIVLHDGGQHTPTASRTATVRAVEMLLDRLPESTSYVTPDDWMSTLKLHPNH